MGLGRGTWLNGAQEARQEGPAERHGAAEGDMFVLKDLYFQ